MGVNSCANWTDWLGDYTGIVYKGLNITLNELRHLKNIWGTPIPEKHNLLYGELKFDSISVTQDFIEEIEKIEKIINDQDILGYNNRNKQIIIKN